MKDTDGMGDGDKFKVMNKLVEQLICRERFEAFFEEFKETKKSQGFPSDLEKSP